MWLSGRQAPDFHTINDFRSKHLKGRINALFTFVVPLMAEEGFVSLTTQYIDGTKFESASNRYTFVWRRSVETHKLRLEEKIRKVFGLIEQAITADNTCALESELSGMSSTELRERLARLTSRLAKPPAPVKKACRKLENKLLPKLQEPQDLVYDPDGDFIICPPGQRMNFIGIKNNIPDLATVTDFILPGRKLSGLFVENAML